jgi:ubiquinol-cytochrome c reductase cytochrome c subunit
VRLLNRPVNGLAGRLSRHRRGPFAGLAVLILGLLLTGSLYAALAPAQAGRAQTDAELVAQGRELFLVGCAYCHGQNGEGMRSSTEDEIAALAAYVASLGVGPAIPDESDYSTAGLSDEELEEAIVRGGQIFLTNCTACHNFEGSGGAMPRGGYAPKIRGVEPKYIYMAMLTGPQAMDTFSNGNLSPEEKRDVIAYIDSLEETPNYGGFGMGALGPVAEGLFAWIVGIGSLVGFAVWIAAHTTRSQKEKAEEAA